MRKWAGRGREDVYRKKDDRPVSKNNLYTLLCAGVIAGLAAPAIAQTYDCEIRQRTWASLVSENYRFEINTDKGQVTVLDSIIRFVQGKPLMAVLEPVSEAEQRVAWSVEEVPTAPEGGPTQAGFEATLVEGEPVEVRVKAVWSDGSEAGTGKGRCARVE